MICTNCGKETSQSKHDAPTVEVILKVKSMLELKAVAQ